MKRAQQNRVLDYSDKGRRANVGGDNRAPTAVVECSGVVKRRGRTVSWCSTDVAKSPAQPHLAHRSQDQDAISVEKDASAPGRLRPYVAQVRGVRRIEHAVDAELRQRFTRILE